jgi:hypothetical protein
MTLQEKIKIIYPSLVNSDFSILNGTIFLQNDSDGKGDYIKSWANINPQPTDEQLNAIG